MILPNPRHELFAHKIADGVASGQAYIEAGYTSATRAVADASGSRLLRNDRVMARVDELRHEVTAGVVRRLVTEKNGRLADLQDVRDRIFQLFRARAKLYGHIAGGDTGLLVAQQRAIGSGPMTKFIEEYVVDAALLRELREYSKQAAIEMGQFAEKRELSGPGGGPVEVVKYLDPTILSDQQLEFLAGIVETIRAESAAEVAGLEATDEQ